jgi:hypothetical protein
MNARWILRGVAAAMVAWSLGSARAADAARPSSTGWEKVPGAERNPVWREARLRQELATAPSAEIRGRIEALLKQTPTPLAAREYLVAVEMLARKEKAGAFSFAREHLFQPLPNRALAEAVVRGWVTVDPDGVEAWIASNEPKASEDDQPELIRLLLRLDAAPDGTRAVARGRRLAGTGDDPGSRFQNNLLTVIEALVMAGRYSEAQAIAKKAEPAGTREAALGNLVALTAPYRPDLAMSWYRELPVGTERSGALFRILEEVSARDFHAAWDFYRSLDASEHSSDRLDTLIASANDFSPADAESVLKELPAGEEKDQLLRTALTRLDALHPSDVPWERIGEISDRAARNRFLESLLLPRYRAQPEPTKRLIARLNFLGADERRALVDWLEARRPREP